MRAAAAPADSLYCERGRREAEGPGLLPQHQSLIMTDQDHDGDRDQYEDWDWDQDWDRDHGRVV